MIPTKPVPPIVRPSIFQTRFPNRGSIIPQVSDGCRLHHPLCPPPFCSAKVRGDRKRWIDNRLQELAGIFSIVVFGFSVLDNHVQLLVRLVPDVAAAWPDLDSSAVDRNLPAIQPLRRIGWALRAVVDRPEEGSSAPAASAQ